METGANNILPKANYSPSTLDNLLTEKCHLSVEIGLNSIGYSIFDTLTLTYIVLKDFEFNSRNIEESIVNLERIITSEFLLKKEFYSSCLSLNNLPSTLVPTPFFNDKKKENILNFNQKIYDDILTDKLQHIDAVNIYSAPTILTELIQKYFPSTQIKSSSSIWIDQLLAQNKEDEKVYAVISDNLLELFVIKNGKLELHNNFVTGSKEDVLYYLLFVMEQLGLSTEKTELVLFGLILKSDELYQLLFNYVRYISFGKRPNNLQYANELESIQKHKYFCLFSQLLCV